MASRLLAAVIVLLLAAFVLIPVAAAPPAAALESERVYDALPAASLGSPVHSYDTHRDSAQRVLHGQGGATGRIGASVGELAPAASSVRAQLRPAADSVAPRTTFSNLDPSDVPRVNGFQALNPNSLSNASGRFNYTVLDDGSLVVANRRYGYIDLANGGDVLAAGEVHIVNGQIRSINNASGHYRPSGASAQSAAEDAFNALDLDVAPGAYREIGG